MDQVVWGAIARPGALTTSISPVQRDGLLEGGQALCAHLGLASNCDQWDDIRTVNG